MTPFRWPAWIDRHGRAYYVGRDLRGHFTTAETIEEPCRHPCCAGKAHPVTVRRVKRKGWDYEGEKADRRPWRTSAEPSAKQRRATDRQRLDYDYAMYLHAHFLAAEDATRGYMVTAAAKARGISGDDFFKPGRRPSVERWGTDEMKAWFETKDRTGTRRILSKTAFEEATHERDQAEARTGRARPRGKTASKARSKARR